MSNGDQPPEVPVVTTPDLKNTAELAAAGFSTAGVWNDLAVALWTSLVDGLKALLTMVADAFDDVAALLTNFFTAAQGQDTPGFNNLVAAVLSDTLGVEVSAADLQQAQFQSGRVGAMRAVGGDLFNTLANEFITGTASPDAGGGIGGLPGVTGTPLTPEQGVEAAKAFIGFALSFAVRQGNVAFLSSALPWEWLGGIREYGEMMAKNLGLGRLVRRALQPYIQTLIATPLQEALNRQYRPHVLDAKQIASAFIRGDIDRSTYADLLTGLGYTDRDIELLIADTYTRLNQVELLLLNETGALSDNDLLTGLQKLGFNSSDIPLLIQARQLEQTQKLDVEYAGMLAQDLAEGRIDQGTYTSILGTLKIAPMVRDAATRNAAHRTQARHKHLSLGFLKRAYMNAVITLDEYLAGAQALGYTQDETDLLEQELLVEQKAAADKVKAKAAAAAAKAAKAKPAPPTPTVP
ncbi:MAG: hypothetical protein DMG78_14860 [Acidobacteria bacterium]|nr:MAG: hypothetical protein DMG78_14860 [Acidobacteriota bacterium]